MMMHFFWSLRDIEDRLGVRLEVGSDTLVAATDGAQWAVKDDALPPIQ